MEESKGGSIVSPIQRKRDFTAERDAEIVPIVRKLLLKLASRSDLKIGSSNLDEAELALFYQKVYQEDVIPLFLEANIKLNSISYVFSLLLQPFQLLSDVTTSSFEMNRDLADAKKYGITDIDDLRVGYLDKALKQTVDKQVDQS